MDIKDRIIQLRNRENLSQVKLAKGIGVSPGNVGDWESGRAKPGADALKNLSAFFNVTIDWIVTGNESSNTVEYDQEKKRRQYQIEVNEDEKSIILMYRNFSSDDKELFKNMISTRYAQISDSLKKKGPSLQSGHGEITSSKEEIGKQMA